MSGTFGGILSIARSALRAQQMAIEVAAQNVANAQTEGYTRARAVLTPLPPRYTPQGVLGTGVAVTDIERVRDRLLDDAYRGEAANATRHNARWEMLTRVEQLFAEPSETGLGAALDRFSDSWNDLANSPTSAAAKQVVAQRGRQVAQWLNGADARITQFETETYTRLTEQVSRINTLLTQIGDLNGQIIPIEAGGGTAAPLRDQRDRMMDELAGLAGATALENNDGSINVIVAGQTMVDQGRAQQFNAPSLVGGTVRLTIGASAEPVQVRTGSVAGLLTVYNSDLPGVRSDLNTIATALVHGVNRWHRTGWTAAGDALSLAGETYSPAVPAGERGSRVDFFASPPGTVPGITPGVSARDIRLSAEVEANVNVIAAGRGGWDGTDVIPQPGDNSIAVAIAGLRTALTMPNDADPGLADPPAQTPLAGLGNRSLGDFWRSAVTDLGLETSRVKSDRDAGEALQQQTDTRRQSVSGVSVDEELIALSRAQQAYQAAARVLSTVQELTADLLSIAR